MRKIRFICRRCGFKFVAEILDPGEAEQRKVNTRPVVCEKCGGSVERA